MASSADLPVCPARCRRCGRACAAGARTSGAASSRPSTGRCCRPRSACRQGAGFVTTEVLRLALFVLPGTLFGAWIGARTYHALSDREFPRRRARPVVSVRRRPGLEQSRPALAAIPASLHGRHAQLASAVRARANSLPLASCPPLHCLANISVCCWVSSAWRSSAARCRRRVSQYWRLIRLP